MRHKLSISTTTTVLVAILVMATASCRSPLSGGGSGSLSISLGGVLPPAAAPREARASGAAPRLILPSTAGLRIRVQGEGVDKTQTATAASRSVTVAGLAPGSSVTVTVDALSPQGTVLTSWTGAVQVGDGDTPVAAILKPIVAPVALEINETNYEALGSPTLAYGEAAFYDVTVAPAIDGEQQILFDTGKARWAWLGVYDADWEPLTPVASDLRQGWVVLDLSARKSFKLVLSNAVASPGYPAGPISGTLASRRTVFFSPGGTGAGTSASPASFTDYAFGNSSANGRSFFLRGGDHFRGPQMDVMSPYHLRFYGGFAYGSWNTRTATTFIYNTSGAENTMVFYGDIHGTLDGLSIVARDIVSPTYVTVRALTIEPSVEGFVINGCSIVGNTNETFGTTTLLSEGVLVGGTGKLEIASSLISGGRTDLQGVSAGPTATAIGLRHTGSALYIHNSRVSGGTATSNMEGLVETVAVRSLASTSPLVIAGCELWGGYAHQESAGSITRSYGIEASTREFLVANSRISGGRAWGIVAPRTMAASYSHSSSPPNFFFHGNTVDAGYPSGEAASDTYAYSIQFNAAPGGGQASSNAFFVSGFIPSAHHAALNIAGTGLLASFTQSASFSTRGLRVEGPSVTYYTDFSNGATTASASHDQARSPALELVKISQAAETYEQFLAQDWRPAAGALYVGKPGVPGPFSPEELAAYPALGLDLAGRPRPAVWAVGAYEP